MNSLPCLEYAVTLLPSFLIRHLTPSNFLDPNHTSFSKSQNLGSYLVANATSKVGIKFGITLLITESDALISKFRSIIEKIKSSYLGLVVIKPFTAAIESCPVITRFDKSSNKLNKSL